MLVEWYLGRRSAMRHLFAWPMIHSQLDEYLELGRVLGRLARLAGLAARRRRRCLFAVVPDVVGDAAATWRRSRPWLDVVRSLGIPVALVAQNGADGHVGTWEHAEEWDALFVGGAPECGRCGWVRREPADRRRRCPSCGGGLQEWKLSAAAKACVDEARLGGKWVHVGRVNSWRRLELMASWNVDSVDGTYLAFGPDANGRRLARWLRRLQCEVPLS